MNTDEHRKELEQQVISAIIGAYRRFLFAGACCQTLLTGSNKVVLKSSGNQSTEPAAGRI